MIVASLQTARRLTLAALGAVALVGAGEAPVSAAPFPSTSRAAVKTYQVRLDAYNVGTFVESRSIGFTASSELEARNAIGNAQAAFARSLNARGKRWNRITHVLLSVN